MSPVEREDFLRERKRGIGGSDVASLLQPYIKEVRYGCRRRLWYDKSGIPEDYAQDDSGPMRLGRILEPHIADWHSEATGDRLSQPGLIVHPKHPELLVHIDRIIEDREHDEPGDAEIKALGPDMFWQTKREGILVDYLLQLDHANLCSGHRWGKFIVGDRAYGGKPLAWTHNAEPEIQKAILAEGPAFWKTLGDDSKSPKRLEPDDKRCGTCQWRRTCHGNALIESTDKKNDLPAAEDIRPLLIEYDEINSKFCEKLPNGDRGTADDLRLAEVKERLKAELGDRAAVSVPWPGAKKDRKVYFRQQDGRVSWEIEDLTQKYERMRLKMREPLEMTEVERITIESLYETIIDRIFDSSVDRIFDGSESVFDVARILAHAVLVVLNRLEEFDTLFPPAESFKRQGVPYKVLRVY